MKRLKPFTGVHYAVCTTDTEVSPVYTVYVDTRFDYQKIRRRYWTKARVPGTPRQSRMPGGSGFRGFKTWEG